MATLDPAASTGRLRVYRSTKRVDLWPPEEVQQHDWSLLLAEIGHRYEEALDRLTVGWRSDIPARVLDEGICVGVLDATSNIITNTLLVAATTAPEAPPVAVVVDGPKLRDMQRRSIEALVEFLTCYYPYLEEWEAVSYLLLAKADPMLAVRIIAEDRGMGPVPRLSISNLKLALRCAMIAAKHPRAAQLADTWMLLLSAKDIFPKVALLISKVQRNFSRDILHSFQELVDETPSVPLPAYLVPMDEILARKLTVDGPRRNVDGTRRNVSVPYDNSGSLRQVILDIIHNYYTTALAMMPASELQRCYQESLLSAGYCYGPFNPVTNIILNTIWYHTAFPPLLHVTELEMVYLDWLMRTEARSFSGLVSFLCTRNNDISLPQALKRLICAGDIFFTLGDEKPATCSIYEESLRAAAIAARHPKPDAQVEFLKRVTMLSPCELSPLFKLGVQLTPHYIQHLARLLCPNKPLVMRTHPISERLHNATVEYEKQERRIVERISRMVKAALLIYQHQHQEQNCSYQLHVICGVNEFSLEKDDGSVYRLITHVNFLVTPHAPDISAVSPMLFFAEISSDIINKRYTQLWCCPLFFDREAVQRCHFCEHRGLRIVHPVMNRFHGRDVEFEKMARGEEPYYYEPADYDPDFDCDFDGEGEPYTVIRLSHIRQLIVV